MTAYDYVFIESGRQDSNLRPSAPKALNSPSAALGFQVITYFLRMIALFVLIKKAIFDGILTEKSKYFLIEFISALI